MRQTRTSSLTLWVLVLGLAAPLAAGATQRQGSCEQIRAICQGAGFAPSAAGSGIGLQVHCIIPIMQGTGQPPRARKPLPRVDPQLVADCAASHPRFGRPNISTEASLQPKPAAPAAPASPGSAANPRGITSALPPDEEPETGPVTLPPQFHRTEIDYRPQEPAGSIIIDTPNTYLYFVLGNGKAIRYGIGVGREGFTWSGTERISRMAEWPDWYPPSEMIDRQPYLPRFMAGGESNPLGARALYLGNTLYRIHGTNQPSTIGTFVSSGCIRLTNEDIADLYGRVQVGTRVVVLPGKRPETAQATSTTPNSPSAPLSRRAHRAND
jgi:lipoprotein-anchoring transpeptidase ErfK/SrfK